ncbi:MAG: divalent-cation tolerance protein CutA [Acidobacteriota bacterium]|nr:MAG: divalent-cation tolerance protein CutA [Acidobacteriota bacterium]
MAVERPHIVVVFCTVPDLDVGRKIARLLVERRLAACVNIVPGLTSIYRWQGEIQDDAEVLLVIKARRVMFDELAAVIAAEHPYEVPEVLALKAVECHEPYAEWLAEVTEIS